MRYEFAMIIACPSCDARYAVEADKIGPAGRTVKCAKCGHSWTQMPEEDDGVQADAPGVEQISESLRESRIGSDAPEPDDEVDFGVDFGAGLQDEPEADDDPAPRRGAVPDAPVRKPRRSGAARLAWLLLIVVVGGVVGGTLAFQSSIVSAWPNAKRFYDLVGLTSVPGTAKFGFQNVKHSDIKVDGRDLIRIEGELVNLSEVPGDVPDLRVNFLDAEGRVVKTWRFPPPERKMLPDETVTFVTQVPAPPPEARRMDVGLATDPVPSPAH